MLIANLIFSLILIWAFIVLLLRQQRQQEVVGEQLKRMRQFYRLSDDAAASLDEQLQHLLSTGCDMLDADVALVMEIDEDAGIGEVRYSYSALPGKYEIANPTVHISDTACLRAFHAEDRLLLNAEGEQPADIQRVLENTQTVQNVIGAPLIVNNRRYGSICFFNLGPHSRSYSELDSEMVRLISCWVRVLQERIVAQNDMQQAKNTADAASQAKSYFLANMSHEIRTPLTTILGYTETLAESEYLNDEDRQIVDTIGDAGKHLHSVLNDILDLTKIEAGQLLIEEISTSPVKIVEQVKRLVQPSLKSKAVRLNTDIQYPIPKRIISDPTRLRQILLNLCSNAIKFTQQGSVTIRLRYLEPMRQLQFTIIDTGMGMDEEELSRILQPFAQADASISRKYGGSGLGLYISQQLVTRLGGHMSFTSQKGQGTEIDFTISARADHMQLYADFDDVSDFTEAEDLSDKPRTTIAPKADTETGGNVLLVEDNEHNHALIQFHLNKLGLHTDFAVNGLEAVKILSEKEYDIVLMDTNMPVMDGEAAIAQLRRNGYNRPIISLTANAMAEDRERCLQAGANDYLTKPLDLPRFNEVIKKFMQENKQSKPAESHNNSELLNDPKFRKLAMQFVEHLPEKVAQLRNAADSGDWQTVKDVSHNLKGLGGGYGLYDITDAAKALNDAMKADDIASGPELLGELCQVCERTVQQFAAH